MEGEVATTLSGFAVEILRAYGLAGLVMAAMALIIWALWSDNKFLRNTNFDMGTKAIEANTANTAALQALRTDVLASRGRGRAGE